MTVRGLWVVAVVLAGVVAWGCTSSSNEPALPAPDVGGDELNASGRVTGMSPVALTAADGVVWVADPAGNQVVAIDAASGAITGVVPAPGYPSVVAAGDAGVFFAERLTGGVIDVTAPDPVVDRWSSGGDFPDDLAVTDDAVWVVNFAGRNLGRLDPSADTGDGGEPDLVVPLGFRPSGVAVVDTNPWVTHTGGNAVVQVTATGDITGSTLVPGGPEALVRWGDNVWVTAGTGGQLVRMSASTAEVTGVADLGFRPVALAVGDTAVPGGDGDTGESRESGVTNPVAQQLVWVADAQNGEVAGVDPVDLSVVERFATGGSPWALTVVDDRVWVADADSGSVVAVDPASGQSMTVQLAGVGGDLGGGGPLRPLPPLAGGVPQAAPVPVGVEQFGVGGAPFYVAASGDSVWVTEFDPDADQSSPSELVRLDSQTGSVTGRWPVDGQAGDVAVVGGVVWVSGFGVGKVFGYDTAGSGLRHTIDLPGGAGSSPLGLTEVFGSLWVALRGGQGMVRIDPTTAAIVDVVDVGAGVTYIAAGTDSLWATAVDDGEVLEVDPATGTVVRRVTVGITPTGLAYGGTPDAPYVWVSVREDSVVVAIDAQTGQVVTRTLVGNRPRGLTVVDDGTGRFTVWVAVGGDGGVAVVDAASGGVETFVTTGGYPLNVASGTSSGSQNVGPALWVTEVDDGWVARLTAG